MLYLSTLVKIGHVSVRELLVCKGWCDEVAGLRASYLFRIACFPRRPVDISHRDGPSGARSGPRLPQTEHRIFAVAVLAGPRPAESGGFRERGSECESHIQPHCKAPPDPPRSPPLPALRGWKPRPPGWRPIGESMESAVRLFCGAAPVCLRFRFLKYRATSCCR